MEVGDAAPSWCPMHAVTHDFVIGNEEVELEHEVGLREMADMETDHDDLNALTVG